MSLRPWVFGSRHSLLRVAPWLEVFREEVLLPDGRRIEDFYRIDLPEYVVVVPLTPDERVVAERHFRPGPRTITLSLPSGYVDENEEPLAAAIRELREETGYASASWTSLGNFVVDGNRGCGTAHFFLARDAYKVSEPDSRDLSEIELRLLSFQDFVRSLRRGESLEMATAAAVGLAHLLTSRSSFRRFASRSVRE